MYDYILVKYLDLEYKITRMEQYRLIGNPDMYGDIYVWEEEESGWVFLEKVRPPKYHDIRDCYTIVCDLQNEGWTLVSGR
jgi:hypothetical protein